MNTAQQILTALGVDPILLTFIRSGKQPQHCKKGPGRKHMQGKPKTAATTRLRISSPLTTA